MANLLLVLGVAGGARNFEESDPEAAKWPHGMSITGIICHRTQSLVVVIIIIGEGGTITISCGRPE